MTNYFETLNNFLGEYTTALAGAVPVRTGTLRDSIGGYIVTSKTENKIEIEVVDYFKYVNTYNNKITQPLDNKFETFADMIANDLWEKIKENEK